VSDVGDFWGCLAAAVGLALFVIAVVMAVVALVSVGSVFGAGVAVRNYSLAFRRNVVPERVAP